MAVQQENLPEDNYHGKQALCKIIASILSRGGETVEWKLVSAIICHFNINLCVLSHRNTHAHSHIYIVDLYSACWMSNYYTM